MTQRSSKRDKIKAVFYEESPSIFKREAGETGKTMMIVGRAYSGKTHFLVENLNRIAGLKRGGKGKDKNRPMYDLVILFTESTDAQPLRGIDPNLNIRLVKGYLPRVVLLLKQVQEESGLAFRFLVLLDDVVSNIRGGTFVKQCLTMRNSNISTTILIQYIKLITPALRNSLMDLYVTGLKVEEWEYLLKSFLSSHAREVVGDIRNINRLASDFRDWIGSDIFHYDNRRDEISLIHREPIMK